MTQHEKTQHITLQDQCICACSLSVSTHCKQEVAASHPGDDPAAFLTLFPHLLSYTLGLLLFV